MMSGFVGEGFEENNSQMQEEQLQANNDQEEGDDVIDIDNPDELAAKGLRRIQIEGEEEEFLMDMEGNIYDLRGNFIGTTDGDGNPTDLNGQQMEEGLDGSELIMDEDGQQYGDDGDEY